jgi:G3E family GTPase
MGSVARYGAAAPDGPAGRDDDRRIPVTLLTGFLGAGKTTLLNHLLRDPQMAGAAVLINEFGEVGIDHHLVEKVDDTLMILDSGCICCSVQGDLVKALRNLAQRASRREIGPLTRVLIETTGLADPVPVIDTLTQERFVAARYRCDGVVAVVAATHAAAQIERHREALRQVAVADRILITKCDLAEAAARAALERRLDALNPGAPRIVVRDGRVEPALLFGAGIYSAAGKLPDVAAWLGAERARAGPAPAWRGRGKGAGHAGGHGAARHDDEVGSFVIEFDAPVPWFGFAVALGRILQKCGDRILRVKGLMNVAGDPLPRVIQCVQEVAYPPLSLARWPAGGAFDDRHGRLVFIARALEREEVLAIHLMLTNLQPNAAKARASMGADVLPTRCWLNHHGGAAAAAIEHAGWTIQTKRLQA